MPKTPKNKTQSQEKTESPEEKFIRTASQRTTKALRMISQIEKAIESPQYSMTQAQVEQIQAAIFIQANKLLPAFGNRKDQKKVEKIVFSW